MDAVSFLAVAAAIWKVMDLLKYARGRDWNGFVTQLFTFGIGIAMAFIFAQADIAQGWEIPGLAVPLGILDGWSLVLLGFVLASSASTLYDFKKAIDRTDSASVPPLLPPVIGHTPTQAPYDPQLSPPRDTSGGSGG